MVQPAQFTRDPELTEVYWRVREGMHGLIGRMHNCWDLNEKPPYALRKAQVTVCLTAQEEITLLYNGKALPYTIYHQQAKQAEIVSAKQLDHVLQEKRLPAKPAPDHPWRRGFATPLSKRGNATSARKGDISILENR